MFFSLEKYNGCQKFVPQLIVKDDTGTEVLLTEQKDVENEISFASIIFEEFKHGLDEPILFKNVFFECLIP